VFSKAIGECAVVDVCKALIDLSSACGCSAAYIHECGGTSVYKNNSDSQVSLLPLLCPTVDCTTSGLI